MKPFADIHWHLLPGNHDPHRPEGLWDRVARLGLPSNIHLHLSPTPFSLDDDAFLLPVPHPGQVFNASVVNAEIGPKARIR